METQPDWIHYLHHQLLSETSHFREVLEDDGDESVIQFHTGRIATLSSQPATWPKQRFAVDLNRDLAFTYNEPFVACYHMKTGLLKAEIAISVPTKVTPPLVVRRGVLDQDGKYLAIIFEAMGPSTDPVGAEMRAGLHLSFTNSTEGFAWRLENAAESGMAVFVAHVAFGIDHAEFVVCLLKLQHEGPARSHLFGIPSWATTPVLTIGTQTMRWELDDLDVLEFSPYSPRLATPFGVFDLESGEKVTPWDFALNLFFQGGKVTSDLGTFGTIRRLEKQSTVELHDVKADTKPREFGLPGIVHLLAISNRSRFPPTAENTKRRRGQDEQQGYVASTAGIDWYMGLP